MTLKVVEAPQRKIPDDVRAAVLKALDAGYPFLMVAKRPNGEWETSCHYRKRLVSDDEVLGVLARVGHRIIAGEMNEEDEGTTS